MRYPISIRRYLQSVGKLLPHRIGQIFQELGFVSWIAEGQSNGVDLIVRNKDGNLFLVAEILNWCPYSELSPTRKHNIISNLEEYNCRKLLVYTALKNESYLGDLANSGISLLEVGFQVLPRFFYEIFATDHRVEQREIDSRETKRFIKSKILEYLQSVGIIAPINS